MMRVDELLDGGARLAERAEHERDGFVEGAQARLNWADGARGGAAVRLVGALSLPDVLGGHLLGALLHHEARLALRLLLQPPRFGRVPGRAQVRALELEEVLLHRVAAEADPHHEVGHEAVTRAELSSRIAARPCCGMWAAKSP